MIEGRDLPGACYGEHENVHIGMQCGREVIDLVAGDASAARWAFDIDVRLTDDGGTDFKGPCVHGRPGERFLYLSWGSVDASGTFTMFCRIKLPLGDVDPDVLRSAMEPKGVLTASVRLTGKDGRPLCGSLRPPVVTWTAD